MAEKRHGRAGKGQAAVIASAPFVDRADHEPADKAADVRDRIHQGNARPPRSSPLRIHPGSTRTGLTSHRLPRAAHERRSNPTKSEPAAPSDTKARPATIIGSAVW